MPQAAQTDRYIPFKACCQYSIQCQHKAIASWATRTRWSIETRARLQTQRPGYARLVVLLYVRFKLVRPSSLHVPTATSPLPRDK